MRAMASCLIVAAGVVLTLAGGPTAAQTALPGDLKERFQAADRNGDGRVDREEFYQRTVEVFFFLDKDRRGYLVVEQLEGVGPAAFKAANRKGDGRLTLQEFVNARFRDFEAADVDKDGAVTLEEVIRYSRSQP